MLSNLIAWVASLFFLFMAGGCAWALFTNNHREGEFHVTACAMIIAFLSLAYGTAKLGGL